MGRRIELSARKVPRQQRSRQMQELILEAAARVLERQGAAAFTTTRVAELAGISVGSLYQYYPNKAALLFRLHEREAEATWSELEAILRDRSLAPGERLRRAVRRYFETESAESELRRSLQHAEVLFEDTREFREIEARAARGIRAFVDEALPDARVVEREFAAELVVALVGGVAERVTLRPLAPAEIRRWSESVTRMLASELGIAQGE
jgi:AcrR family transcriptional regulator